MHLLWRSKTIPYEINYYRKPDHPPALLLFATGISSVLKEQVKVRPKDLVFSAGSEGVTDLSATLLSFCDHRS